MEKLFVFATGLFTIHSPLPHACPRFFRRSVPRLSRMDFHIITSPDVAATRNASLFPRDSSRTCHFYTLLEPFISLSPFFTPFSLNFFPILL